MRVILSMCCTESYGARWYKDVKHASPSAKRVLRYLRWDSRASKSISCVHTQYKKGNIFTAFCIVTSFSWYVPLLKLCESNYISSLFLRRRSIRSISHCRAHCHRFRIRSWRVWQRTRKLSSNTTSYDDITFLVLGTYTRYPFWCSGIPTKIPQKPFCAWWRIFNVFVSTCAVAFRKTHGKNNTHKWYTEGFVPVASLCGVV